MREELWVEVQQQNAERIEYKRGGGRLGGSTAYALDRKTNDRLHTYVVGSSGGGLGLGLDQDIIILLRPKT